MVGIVQRYYELVTSSFDPKFHRMNHVLFNTTDRNIDSVAETLKKGPLLATYGRETVSIERRKDFINTWAS